MTSFKRRDGHTYVYPNTKNSKAIKALIECNFDEQVDQDETEILTLIELTKILKKACIIKLALYPAEWILTRLIMGREASVVLELSIREYYKFLRGFTTVEHFRKFI